MELHRNAIISSWQWGRCVVRCSSFYCCLDCRYGYPDYTYLSRVRSELAAKGIGLSSASSSPVTSAAAAGTTPTPTVLSSPVTSRTSTHTSVRSSAGNHVPGAASDRSGRRTRQDDTAIRGHYFRH